ncbi:TPA: hypothetical protein ROX85_001840 [Bacillus thuringiensis]|nr:hypothetical protein [Bacillus thuringiensis]
MSRLQTRHGRSHCSFQDEYSQGKEQSHLSLLLLVSIPVLPLSLHHVQSS